MFNWNLRYQYLLIDFNTYTHTEVYIEINMYMHASVYIHILPSSVYGKNLQAKTAQ